MRLFVGPLPGWVGQQDVCAFIESGIRPSRLHQLLFKSPRLLSCTLMEVPGNDGRAPIYFAIVNLYPGRSANKVIAMLDGKKIGNQGVKVREYIERDARNDRRHRALKQSSHDLRHGDRRHPAVRRVINAQHLEAIKLMKELLRIKR